MSALLSMSGNWQTPPWLISKCRAALGGYITLDAAASTDNVEPDFFYSAAEDALEQSWLSDVKFGRFTSPTLFLNPPGERSGKLIRRFWAKWDAESRGFHASVWVDFNLDHLRFIKRTGDDCLIIPRKRMAFVDPLTGKERKGAQIGGFILFRGYYGCSPDHPGISELFPEPDFLTMWGHG